MAKGIGQISFLIDSPLRTLVLALRTVDKETRSQINKATKAEAQPIWFEETRDRAVTKLQQKNLVSTARVGVTSRNVILRSGGLVYPGRNGDKVTRAVEFGGDPDKIINSTSSKGKSYKRRMGATFGPRYRNGAVVYPAAFDSIPRFASLWVQTTIRTLHEAIEKGSS